MGLDTLGIGKALGASSPDGLSGEDALVAIENLLGIPGGTIPAGGIGSAEFPAYANIGTSAGSLHDILAAIIPGGGGATLAVEQWEYELTATLPKNTNVAATDFTGVLSTTGDAPLADWATSKGVSMEAAGIVVARTGTAAATDLLGTYTAAPERVSFNRDLYTGNRIVVKELTGPAGGPLDLLYLPPVTLGVGEATFAADSKTVALIGDAGANSVTTITGTFAFQGSEIDILFQDGLVTIVDDDGATANTINLVGVTTNFTGSANDVLTLLFTGTKWIEKSRSVN